MTTKSTTYEDAGVNISAGNALVENIKPIVKETLRDGANTELGGFGGLFNLSDTEYHNPILVSGTDSVGTKVKIAEATGKFDTIGIDLVAMCVNDIIAQGAEPLFFLDYYATGKLDVDIASTVIKGVAEGCKQAGCALIGGETAEMPGVYSDGNFDLVGFAVGAVTQEKLLPNPNINPGDIVIGLPSSGLHSNGFSLVRHIIEKAGLNYNDTAPFADTSLGEALLTPTIIYYEQIKSMLKGKQAKAIAHITGGGLTENLPRIISDDYAIEVDISAWERPAIFNWLQETGNISSEEMLSTFNCGIGLALIISKNNIDAVSEILKFDNIAHYKIGIVKERTGPAVEYINV